MNGYKIAREDVLYREIDVFRAIRRLCSWALLGMVAGLGTGLAIGLAIAKEIK
ncbi:MAG: hypothetical protein V4472_24980 [Pseudomonadota bacterium]